MSWNSDLPLSSISSTWIQNFCPGHMASVSANQPSLMRVLAELEGVRETPEENLVLCDIWFCVHWQCWMLHCSIIIASWKWLVVDCQIKSWSPKGNIWYGLCSVQCALCSSYMMCRRQHNCFQGSPKNNGSLLLNLSHNSVGKIKKWDEFIFLNCKPKFSRLQLWPGGRNGWMKNAG